MGLKAEELQQLASYLNGQIARERVSKIVQYDDDVFLFSLSREGRLAIVVNNQDPYVYLTDSGRKGNSLSSTFAAQLRKRIGGSEIVSVSPINEDRILDFHLRGLNDVFKEEDLHLIVELIPTKANLILVDASFSILGSLRTTYITDPHPVFRGATYLPPEKAFGFSKSGLELDVPSYMAKCEEKEEELSNRRLRTKFQSVYRLIATKRKSSKRKIATIEADIEKAKKHLQDGDYGSFIYMNMETVDSSSGSMDYYGTPIALDKRKSNAQNAEAFYRSAKKAKTALALGEKNLQNAIEESKSYENLAKTLSICDEAALEKLAEEYGLNPKEKEVNSPLKNANLLPYKTSILGFEVLFGKNSKENDFLSFLYKTDKDAMWFHAKDQKGAHLIATKKDLTPKEKEACCELVLLASNLLEGEVMYTEHKNIRRGRVPGLAIVKTYESALIRHISPDAKKAYEEAEKLRI